MTLEAEIAAFIDHLDERVERLKTLEAAGGAGGDSDIFHQESVIADGTSNTTTFTIPVGYNHAFQIETWVHDFNWPLGNTAGGQGNENAIAWGVHASYWYKSTWSSAGGVINQSNADAKDGGGGPNRDPISPLDTECRGVYWRFHFDIEDTTYHKPEIEAHGYINDEVPLKGGGGLDHNVWVMTASLQVAARLATVASRPRVVLTTVNFAVGSYQSLYMMN